LHRPKDVDTASALALLQEEELESRKRVAGKHDQSSSRVFSTFDKAKSAYKRDELKKTDKSANDSKLADLMAYRKANGLCFTCGDKWTGRTHKCPDKVPLHVIQEVLELFHIDPNSESDTSDIDPDSTTDCVLSVQDLPSEKLKKRRKTMRFKGLVGKQELLILLDSGSAGTFVSQAVAQQFQSSVQSCEELHFTTADGSPMTSAHLIPEFQWMIQGISFSYDVRVLPLQQFDMIIGADWLEDHSPTWIHWKKKQMKFPLGGKRVVLHGLTDDLSSCKSIAPGKLKGLL